MLGESHKSSIELPQHYEDVPFKGEGFLLSIHEEKLSMHKQSVTNKQMLESGLRDLNQPWKVRG